MSKKSLYLRFVWLGILQLVFINTALTSSNKPLHSKTSFGYRTPEPVNGETAVTARWIYGLSIGLYVPDNSTANYYNGSDEEHNLERALNLYYNRDRIVREVDEIIESFEVYELPMAMQYNPAVQVGFYGGLVFNNAFAVTGEFNYTKLRVSDRFTLATDKETFTTEPYLLLSDIFASEERIELRLGVQYTLQTSSYMHPFVESGINITDTKILENRVRVGGLNINIRDARSDYYGIRDYGMGFGIFTAAGIKMDVTDTFSLRFGGSVSFSRINLGDNRNVRPQYTAFLRLDLNEVFASH